MAGRRRNDLTGMVIGFWKVVEYVGGKKCKYRCECVCGSIKDVNSESLRSGLSASCGCKRNIIDISGHRFNNLVVVSYLGNGGWLCLCDCGNEAIVNTYKLKSGEIKGCGCGRLSKDTKINKGDWHHPLYHRWRQMINRCTKSQTKGYKNYGGRGIKVCERWMNFSNFLEDVGKPPEGNYTFGRIDNDGDYEISNFEWQNAKTQSRNTRVNRKISYNGITKTAIEWSEDFNIKYETFLRRLNAGWSMEKIKTTKIRTWNKNDNPLESERPSELQSD
jgi:hypothetical protein